MAVVLADRDRELELLLIRRAERAGDVWSGQMAFPGGRQSPADSSLLVTAIRETREEVGLDLETAELLGQLDDVRPQTPALPPIGIRPFLFHLTEPVPLSHSPEVAESFWISLGLLGAAESRREVEVRVRGQVLRVPAYLVGSHVVWGLTERILLPLLGIVFPAGSR